MIEVVEVVIGMLAVFSIFLLLYQPISHPDLKPSEAKISVLGFLTALDDQGVLANLVLANNTTVIKQELEEAFPLMNFEVWVGDGYPQIQSNTTYSVVYFVPGNYTNFKPSKLTVYMWFS